MGAWHRAGLQDCVGPGSLGVQSLGAGGQSEQQARAAPEEEGGSLVQAFPTPLDSPRRAQAPASI